MEAIIFRKSDGSVKIFDLSRLQKDIKESLLKKLMISGKL